MRYHDSMDRNAYGSNSATENPAGLAEPSCIIDRYDLAVGQGLFHFAKVKYRDISRSMSIVYDCGAKPKGKNADAEVDFVCNILKSDCDSTIDYLFISHFHEDHFNLIARLVKDMKIRFMYAPFLDNNGRAMLTAVLLDLAADDAQQEEILRQAIASEVINNPIPLFRNVINESRDNGRKTSIHPFPAKGDTSDYGAEELMRTSGKITQPEDVYVDDSFKDKSPSGIFKDSPIVVHSTDNQRLWSFYLSMPNSIECFNYEEVAKMLTQRVNNCLYFKDSFRDAPKAVSAATRQILDNECWEFMQGKERCGEIKNWTRKFKNQLKETYHQANLNETSLCVRSMPCLSNSYSEIKYVEFTLEQKVNDKFQEGKLKEHWESTTTERLDSIINGIRDNGEQYSSYFSGVDYGGWLGLGDASIDSAEFLGSDINICKLIMSCSVPHHGSRTGFTTAALPAALEHAIAVVSCQPSYSAYNHPHLESYENMVVNANLVPYLVTDDKDSRLHIQLKYRQLCEETNIPVDNPIPLKKAYFNMPSTNKLVITFECKVNDEDKPCSFIYEPPEYIEFSEDIEIDETDSAFPLT